MCLKCNIPLGAKYCDTKTGQGYISVVGKDGQPCWIEYDLAEEVRRHQEDWKQYNDELGREWED